MPQQRILPYIILGILSGQKQMNGIQITNVFKTEIGEFWRSSHSQIYPELKRMLDDNWVKVVPTEENDKEIYYQMTGDGQKVLDEWLVESNTIPLPSKDLFALKMYFIQDKNDPRIIQLLEEQRELVKDNILHLEERNRLLFSKEETVNSNYGHFLILDRAIKRQKGFLRWLNKQIKQYKDA